MDTKVRCLAVYIVIDTSWSMHASEEALNATIEGIYDKLITSPRISDFVKLCVVSYNADAEVILPMTGIQALDAVP